MSVERGAEWGTTGALPDGAPVCATDAEVRSLVERAAARRDAPPWGPVGLVGGDLRRTLGGRRDAATLHDPHAARATVDVGTVLLDGTLHRFVAHLVARQARWHGRFVVVANAAFLDGGNVAPQAHPGDGRFDVLDGALGFGDRLRARRRLATGTHVPHPGIATSRAASATFEFERPIPVCLDGVAVGRFRSIVVHLEPDALAVVV